LGDSEQIIRHEPFTTVMYHQLLTQGATEGDLLHHHVPAEEHHDGFGFTLIIHVLRSSAESVNTEEFPLGRASVFTLGTDEFLSITSRTTDHAIKGDLL